MDKGMHTHNFHGETSYNQGHTHQYLGRTTPSPDTEGHIHYLIGFTTFEDGHMHHYVIPTGPPIEGNGGHYHHYQGNTMAANAHVHLMEGDTSTYKETT